MPRGHALLAAALLAGRAAAGVAVKVLVNPGEPGGLEAARARARMVAVLGARPVEIVLEAGTYPLSHPLVLTVSDSGTAGAPVTWKAAPGAVVRISGGREIGGWSPVVDPRILARLDLAIRSRVVGERSSSQIRDATGLST